MKNDIFAEFVYDKNLTQKSKIVISNSLIDYSKLVHREGSKTLISDTPVIDMDFIKNSLKITPSPSSIDLVFIIKKRQI